MLAEHYHPVISAFVPAARHAVKWVLNYRNLRKNKALLVPFSELLPYSPVKGNHHYGLGQYRKFFHCNGFEFKRTVDKKRGVQNFILYCPDQ